MLFLWIVIFIFSLFVLVKGADYLLFAAEKIGLASGMSKFTIGITIIAIGTSIPELLSSLVATFQGLNEYAVATAVGSNVANVFLIIGVAAILAKRLFVKKEQVNLDLPILSIATALFLIMVLDGKIEFFESVILLLAYVIYIVFSIFYKSERKEILKHKPKIRLLDILILILGSVGLFVGSKYLIESVVEISSILNIAPTLIAITVVSVGTSMPELVVSVKAALRRQSEIALGNIVGSNIFRLLFMVGVSGIFTTLKIDVQTYTIGLLFLVISTLIFVISSFSRRITMQEGALYVVMYAVFIAKLFNLF
jgi:cation:H+ antiporter